MSEHLYLLTRIEEVLGFADDPIPQVIEATVDELTTVRERDVLGQTVVERLGEVYDSVALLTLNGPRAVVWRERLHGAAAPDQIGRTIDIESRGVIHRVSEEHVFYWGPLPASSPLRSAFRVTHDERVLVAPVDLRGKTVLILLLDAGGADFPSPGRYLERLLLELSRSLERVILQRRQKRRR